MISRTWYAFAPCLLLALVSQAGTAAASTEMSLSFERLTFNSRMAADMATHFSAVVTNLGGGAVRFDIYNTGADAAGITDIYWEESTDDIIDYASVALPPKWSVGAYPLRLPGTTNDTFPVAFSAEVDVAADSSGVLSGESVSFVFNLAEGATFNALAHALESGDLRLGIYVEQLQGGFSAFGPSLMNYGDSFIMNGTNTVVPIPAGAGLGAVGLACIGVLRSLRRRFSRV